jgi:hypothetical protein
VGSEIVLSPEAEARAEYISNGHPLQQLTHDRILALVRSEVERADKRWQTGLGYATPDEAWKNYREQTGRLSSLGREQGARIAELLACGSHCDGCIACLLEARDVLRLVNKSNLDSYIAAAKERDALKAEVARLHGLLQRADAELPPENPVQQVVSRTLQSCSDQYVRLEDNRDMWKRLEDIRTHERDSALADLAEARKQIEEAVVVIGHGRRMLRRLNAGETVWHEDEQVLLHGALAEEDDMPQAELDAARALLATGGEHV